MNERVLPFVDLRDLETQYSVAAWRAVMNLMCFAGEETSANYYDPSHPRNQGTLKALCYYAHQPGIETIVPTVTHVRELRTTGASTGNQHSDYFGAGLLLNRPSMPPIVPPELIAAQQIYLKRDSLLSHQAARLGMLKLDIELLSNHYKDFAVDSIVYKKSAEIIPFMKRTIQGFVGEYDERGYNQQESAYLKEDARV